ncbi:MAG: IS3 family transposase [Ardenticatenaceae bacterium]|nr:IS3 family transposase [Ardenticatenaceae bacterium]
MSKTRRRYSADYKFKVALEAAKGTKTLAEIASGTGVHPNQISQWKRQLLEEGAHVFRSNGTQPQREFEEREAELYEQIGRLKMELEWLKKQLPPSTEARRALIEPRHPNISIRRQCELLGLNRSTYSSEPAGESAFNLRLMRLIDEQYLKTPFYGWPKMTASLRRQGYPVNHKRVQRLMRLMGLQAIYPKPKTTVPGQGHTVSPYRLRGLEIVRPNQVWSSDITYVPMQHGFMYLVVILDWFSRSVLTWHLSNTLDGRFCLEALQQALPVGHPEIFNTDQGGQFTALEFTDYLAPTGIRISRDGRGRALDNIFVERLWRSVKYEDLYLKDYASVPDLAAGLDHYFRFYNHERPPQSLDYRTPAEVHYG